MYKVIIISIVGLLLTANGSAQNAKISLQNAIRVAQENSFEYKIAQYRRQGSVWRFENYKASFLPTLFMNGTIPNYTRAINKITLPSGEDTFVSQNQAYSSVNLGIRQNVSLTGGTFSVNSFLNRIDVFGNDKQTRYSSTPFSISYFQEMLGYNSFKWQKKIEPLQLESANRQYLSDMERIASQTVSFFFNVLSAKGKYELSKQNLANVDTLYRITQDRFRLGNVDQSSLLQLKLNNLNAQRQVDQDSIEYMLSKKQFNSYLRLPESDAIELVFEEEVDFFDVPFDQAINYANENSQNVINFRLKRLEAEQNVAQTKAQYGLKFNISANFGITNTSNTLKEIFTGIENQQQVSLGFSLPILDWGYAKTQKQRAEANLEMVKSEIEQQQLTIEQEINLHVAKWQLQKKQLQVARESREISLKNYNLEMDRFLRGTISINDLNISQQQKDNSFNTYIETIKGYWELYYAIRRLTFYDFKNSRKL